MRDEGVPFRDAPNYGFVYRGKSLNRSLNEKKGGLFELIVKELGSNNRDFVV